MFTFKKHRVLAADILILATFTLFAALSMYGIVVHQIKFILGGCFWFFFLFLLYISRKEGYLNTMSCDTIGKKETVLIVLTILITIFFCTIPMGICPVWNGEDAQHRNQYELMAVSLQKGHLHITYDDADVTALQSLENPYDPQERIEKDVPFHWDHAFYNGHYYMYFGIVPVLMLFLPFLIFTGISLTTYHATQFYTACIIIGIFVLFRLIVRHYFKKMRLGMYLSLSTTFSVISVWFPSAAPALYCTAITAGVCMQIWSIYFFCKAVWETTSENRQLTLAGIGSLLGALTFGCRPTIGLANIIVIPLLCTFLRHHKMTPKLFGKLCLAATPYVLVAFALMAYNYARFDNPFEFGQSYQLTVTDQRNIFRSVPVIRIINETIRNFVGYSDITSDFPYISHSSLFFNFPIFFCIFTGFLPHVSLSIRKKNLLFFTVTLATSILLITVADVIGSPQLMERYRSDIYFLAGILCFLIIGFWYESIPSLSQPRFSSAITKLSVLMLFMAVFRYLCELNTQMDYMVDRIENFICFWRFL